MISKNFVIFFLLSLYTLVLAHGAIPHDHTENGGSHVHIGNSNHHHHENNEDHHSKEAAGNNPFLALHLMLGHSEQIFINQTSHNISLKVKEIVKDSNFKSPDFSRTITADTNEAVPQEQSFYSFTSVFSKGLRAPPALV